jgi:HipA-like C-terminal domain
MGESGLDLARGAGLEVPDSQLIHIGDRSVLIVDRFDRRGASRIGYSSAMTMLEASDGDERSYLEIAGVIEERSRPGSWSSASGWRLRGGPLPVAFPRMAQRAAPEGGDAVAPWAYPGSPAALIATSAKSLSARIGVAPYLPARYLRPIASSMRGLRSESAYSLLAPSSLFSVNQI